MSNLLQKGDGNNLPALSPFYVNEQGQVTRPVEVPTEHPDWYFVSEGCHLWTPELIHRHVRRHPKTLVFSDGKELIVSLKDAYLIANRITRRKRGRDLCMVNFINYCYWYGEGSLLCIKDMGMIPENDPLLILLNA